VRFKNPANQLSAYDTTGLLPAVCEQPQAVKDACAFCTDLCKVVAPLPPATGCAAYPEVGAPPPEKCESCPEYCRFTDYLFIKDYSNTPMTAPSSSGGKPQKCDEAAPSKISCGGNACLGKCKTGDDPLLCRAYKELSGEPAEGCRKCPTQARLILKHTAGGATTSFPPDYAPSYEANCGGADCASACKQERTVPSQSGGSCLDYNPSGGKLQAPGRQEGIFLAADGSQIAGKQAQPGQGGPMLAAGGASMPGERGGIGLASRAGKDELALAMGTAFPSGAPAFQGALFAAAPKPDYVVTAPAAMTVAVGAPFTFTFSTDNIGDASPSSSSTTTVSFLSSTQSLNVVPLAPEGSQQDSIQLTCTQAGTFTITTTADANGQIGESNENNNVATTSVLCTQECQTCPYDCRVAGLPSGVLDPSCAAKCAACPDSCKAAAAAPLICSEYLGNGPGGSCSGGGVCPSYADEASCKAASCSWQASTGKMCYGPGSCNSYGEGPCYEHSADGCIWADESGDPSVPLGYRIDPAYTDASGCKQCPENCRIAGYAGQCGYSEAAGAPRTVDCSPSECAAACRVPPLPVPEPVVPPPTPAPSVDPDCGYYIAGDACHDCPLLCRRLGDKPQVKYCTLAKDYCGLPNAKEGIGCPDNCKLPDAPRVLCESCFDCPLDCTYYPAIRTDCSDVCSDEALAGPVSIGPDDFLKKLPGAEGEPDVKNVGNLMVPGLVLPLFCIVIVVAFIRVFSPVLGGDIEIPGLGRII
jgi:hypothetical protein